MPISSTVSKTLPHVIVPGQVVVYCNGFRAISELRVGRVVEVKVNSANPWHNMVKIAWPPLGRMSSVAIYNIIPLDTLIQEATTKAQAAMRL